MSKPILIAYDGSDDASAAIVAAGDLFGGREVVVLTIREPAARIISGTDAALPSATTVEAMAELDARARDEAETTAAHGAALAREAGLEAVPAAASERLKVWSTILAEADQREAAAIVVGSRGRTPIKALVLGSVSAALSTQSYIPVVVVRANDQPGA